MKSAFFIVILSMGCHFLKAQTNYTYDANGNRTLRNTVSLMSQPVDSIQQDSINILDEKDYLLLESNHKEDLGEQSIIIYPNPTGGAFAVRVTSMPAALERKMLLYSIGGNEIYRSEDFDELTVIDLSGKENGTYVLKILLGDKRSTWKIIKQ
ncbi:MAG: T9SS type A sorting domain-containing protein [Bacteroidales bacterium]|nr:T9SS type A sorting domain-containing protein [Bacteroidales bacterium]MCF8387874.1 T9SS type A sorting domain-containing protein [Bacteroidales bacterium]MCF8396585.1 T9SS type A sorting domain-containing protein [Bacteroidales bacterium]